MNWLLYATATGLILAFCILFVMELTNNKEISYVYPAVHHGLPATDTADIKVYWV